MAEASRGDDVYGVSLLVAESRNNKVRLLTITRCRRAGGSSYE